MYSPVFRLSTSPEEIRAHNIWTTRLYKICIIKTIQICNIFVLSISKDKSQEILSMMMEINYSLKTK